MNKKKIILLSLGISILLMCLKFWAYSLTHSTAILTDALESIVNVLAGSFAFYSLWIAAQPKDPNHPYGHGKIEFFSAGFEGGFIIMAGILSLYEAYEAFINPKIIENTTIGLIIITFTLFMNGGLGLFLKKEGKKANSITLIAEGEHLFSDGISSVFLITGILLVKLTNLFWIDTVLAILLALFLLKSGYSLVRRAVAGLMDEIAPEILDKLANILQKNRRNTWIDVHNVRIQQYGADLHIDAHLTLPYYQTLKEAHEEVLAFENVFKTNFDAEVEIFTHTDPCLPACCSYCLVENCTKRSDIFKEKIDWNIEKLTNNAKHFQTITS